MDSISVRLFYCAVCYYTFHVWFCSDWSGRLVPQDWSEEPACGSAPDRCTDTWWAVSGHNKWFTGIWSVQMSIITILCFREHACCNCSCWTVFIDIHYQLSNLAFKINLTVIARACQSVIMTVPLPPGEIPELFSEEEIEGILSGVRAEVRALGLLDSRENGWRFFTDRVRRQLTV